MTYDVSSAASSCRLAASVILLRDAPGGFETFMLRRSSRSPFAPDAFVFPGGAVDDRDRSDAMRARAHGIDEALLAAEFRAADPPSLPHDVPPIAPGDAAALKIAALRELFEESGVLIALGSSTRAHEDVDEALRRVRAGELAFSDLLAGGGLRADASALSLFSHWVTPPSEPRRYNTHFFVARMPEGQDAGVDAHETHDGMWIAPGDALSRASDGEFLLVYPTIKHLTRLAQFDSVDSLIAYAKEKPILTIVPTGTIPDGFAMPPELEDAW